MSTAPYPIWQHQLRQAQDSQRRLAEAQRAALAREAIQREAEYGRYLSDALTLLGIRPEELPTTNSYTVDGFTFSLALAQGQCDAQQRAAYTRGLRRHDHAGSSYSTEYISFDLLVTSHPAWAGQIEDYPYAATCRCLRVATRTLAGDWTAEQARLADYLDELQEARMIQEERAPMPGEPRYVNELDERDQQACGYMQAAISALEAGTEPISPGQRLLLAIAEYLDSQTCHAW